MERVKHGIKGQTYRYRIELEIFIRDKNRENDWQTKKIFFRFNQSSSLKIHINLRSELIKD